MLENEFVKYAVEWKLSHYAFVFNPAPSSNSRVLRVRLAHPELCGMRVRQHYLLRSSEVQTWNLERLEETIYPLDQRFIVLLVIKCQQLFSCWTVAGVA